MFRRQIVSEGVLGVGMGTFQRYGPAIVTIFAITGSLINSPGIAKEISTSTQEQNTEAFIIEQTDRILVNIPHPQPSIFGQFPNPITPEPPLTEPTRRPQLLPAPIPSSPTEVPDIPGEIVINQFKFVGNTAFGEQELAKVLVEFINRPLTFAELLQAEATITKLYTDAGYINSGAVIPAGQNLSSGIVTLQIIEGGLEDIIIAGTGRLNVDYVKSRLEIATGKPLNTNRLLRALQLLQLDPLIETISAELTAGSRPELSVLQVSVKPAQTLSAQLIFDNGRSPSVGTFRRGIEFTQANTLGLGDRISTNYTNTEGSNAFEISYTLPINPRNGTLNLTYGRTSSNIIESPFKRLDITGNSSRYELTYRQPLYRTPTQEFALGISATHQDSQTTILGEKEPLSPGADADGKTRISALRFTQEWVQRSPRSVLAARSQFSLGVNALNATLNQDPPDSRFLSWRGQLQYVRLLAPATLLVLRSDLQLANKSLVPLEQISLGGFRSVRGYRQDVSLTDNGFFVSAELQIPVARFSTDNLLKVVPFIDYGSGWNHSESNTPQSNRLLGAGLGLQLQLGSRFTGRLEYGIPLLEVTDQDSKTWQEKGIYFSILYNPF